MGKLEGEVRLTAACQSIRTALLDPIRRGRDAICAMVSWELRNALWYFR